MSYLIDNAQKLNDVIFANRNKAYGAYAIRSSYGETVLKSLGTMIFAVAILFGTAFYLSHRNDEKKSVMTDKIRDSIYVIPVYLKAEEIQKPEEPAPAELPAPAAKPALATLSTNFLDSVIQQETDTSFQFAVITKTVDNSNVVTIGQSQISNTASASGTLANNTKPIVAVKGLLEVDTQPEFEGGLQALNKFIGSHLRYPEEASREGQEGKVYVRFVVDEEGNVGDLMLMNRLGYGMDEEALRVVKLIPKFKSPAKVKGEPVKAYYQVPIRYHYR